MPFYPSKVLQAREHASTPYTSVVFSLDSHLSPSRNWERVTTKVLGPLFKQLRTLDLKSKIFLINQGMNSLSYEIIKAIIKSAKI